ncbi:glycine-rich protein DOT1-like [Spinacia oleracea]|uniref:Glycine-rich protein DOT1-like n=1 Tax=Spinacia oleracea TaxID=3562 RepID=A0ABM3R904_SPIOL|nr:glycine-rich protein DOT1-like [Spinacia oleracea]
MKKALSVAGKSNSGGILENTAGEGGKRAKQGKHEGRREGGRERGGWAGLGFAGNFDGDGDGEGWFAGVLGAEVGWRDDEGGWRWWWLWEVVRKRGNETGEARREEGAGEGGGACDGVVGRRWSGWLGMLRQVVDDGGENGGGNGGGCGGGRRWLVGLNHRKTRIEIEIEIVFGLLLKFHLNF